MDTSKTYKELSDKASPLKPDSQIERVKWYEDPIYILQCEKAEEIQKQVEHTFAVPDDRNSFCYTFENVYWFRYDGHSVWLPRQDDLQEMIDLSPTSLVRAIYAFCYDGKCASLTSMEQLWLAFVMFERYNKIWDGKEWKEVMS